MLTMVDAIPRSPESTERDVDEEIGIDVLADGSEPGSGASNQQTIDGKMSENGQAGCVVETTPLITGKTCKSITS